MNDIIRFTNGDDGVFAHVSTPEGKHYGVNVDHLADGDDLVNKFFAAVAERVRAGEPEHQCCGKCEKPAEEAIDWRARYMREVEGLNNEGDPIGGEPAMGLRQVVERQNIMLHEFANRLQNADALIVTLVQKAGGSVTFTKEDGERAAGQVIELDPGAAELTLRAVPVPQPTEQ